jgi:hypothetical protein
MARVDVWGSGGRRRRRPFAARLLFLLPALVLLASPGGAQNAMPAAEPLVIPVFTTSRTDVCFSNGNAEAIRALATAERDRINAAGGIAGRRLDLVFLDDGRDPAQAVTDVRAALGMDRAIAMIGLTGARARTVFDEAGAEIKASGIPLMSSIGVNSMFANYPNVFTMRGSQEEDSIPVILQFLKDNQIKRPAFLGVKDQFFSTMVADGFRRAQNGGDGFIADVRFTLKDNKLDLDEVKAAVAELKEKQPDFLLLSLGTQRAGDMISELRAAGLTLPMLVWGRIEAVFGSKAEPYPSDVYQITWSGLPNAYTDKLRRRLIGSDPQVWQFEGARIASAPGWANGECKDLAPEETGVLTAANLRAIETGAQYADMVGLAADALRKAPVGASVPEMRALLIKQLTTTYAAGRGVYRGMFENWSFRPRNRVAARTPFIIVRPAGLGTQLLSHTQYAGVRDGTLRPFRTLYMDIDLVRAFRIDDNEKSFAAEFYVSIHGASGASIDQIDFANAMIDPRTNSRQVTVRILHGGGPSDVYPPDMKVYAVSGKFLFDPDFTKYPFDTQIFSIDIRPKSGEAPFILQPPPENLRDKAVDADQWQVETQYVGYGEDYLPVIDARSHEQTVVPFYRGSFVWVMNRETTDYFLTVVVPLAFILGMAYLAIFIPQSHFEAIVTIQVTALLSAVALYIAIPKVDSDTATLSDRIFLFDYFAVSLMIGISILRVNKRIAATPWLKTGLGIVHIVGIPVLVGLMVLYVLDGSLLEGQTLRDVTAGMFS